MFFLLSKLLTFVTSPLAVGMLLLLAAIILRRYRPKLARILFVAGLATLYVFSIHPVANLLMLSLEHPYDNQPPPIQDFRAIVVLAGMVDLARSSPVRAELADNADRLIEGILLALEFPETLLVMAGGSGDPFHQGSRESVHMKRLALRLGIPEYRIRTDTASRNTYENAVETAKILQAEGIDRFLLVSSASHMKRSLACFHKVGLEPIHHAVDFRRHPWSLSPLSFLPSIRNLEKSANVFHEYVGLVAYKIRGYI